MILILLIWSLLNFILIWEISLILLFLIVKITKFLLLNTDILILINLILKFFMIRKRKYKKLYKWKYINDINENIGINLNGIIFSM